MKLSESLRSLLSFGTILLPVLVQSALLPKFSQPIQHLQKRGYHSSWVIRTSIDRFYLGRSDFLLLCKPHEVSTQTSERTIRLPRISGTWIRYIKLPLCTLTLECLGEVPSTATGPVNITTTTPKQDEQIYILHNTIHRMYNDCPATERELMNKLISAEDVFGLHHNLTMEEIYAGLHHMDPKMFPYASWRERLWAIPDGLEEGCVKFYTALTDDSCDSIAGSHGISVEDFHSWNPQVDGAGGRCTRLGIGKSYCVSWGIN
ncbi:hypothetical protein BJ508DRAFT_373103 [Ascobolus immersus RN42]|uniref:LysM domain-containing protein n=1 Tax=Ascobolus immersus RN42 TaxID=1160509 RepID=A0A3N4IL38_ASCIM|nr:hypothetical protein BJ508DRAFT_373103 [Ascobolus immersus RN42]